MRTRARPKRRPDAAVLFVAAHENERVRAPCRPGVFDLGRLIGAQIPLRVDDPTGDESFEAEVRRDRTAQRKRAFMTVERAGPGCEIPDGPGEQPWRAPRCQGIGAAHAEAAEPIAAVEAE